MQVIECAVSKWCQCLPLAFMLEEDILSTCCNEDDLMRDAYLLRYSNCQSCLLLFSL